MHLGCTTSLSLVLSDQMVSSIFTPQKALDAAAARSRTCSSEYDRSQAKLAAGCDLIAPKMFFLWFQRAKTSVMARTEILAFSHAEQCQLTDSIQDLVSDEANQIFQAHSTTKRSPSSIP